MAAHSSTLSWAALLLACLAVLQQPAAANAYSSDAEALLALKASFTNGDEVFTTWQPGTDACAWKGVSCDTARTVVKLELVGLGLVGSAPQPDGWPLPASLQELYFGEMPNVTGPIPPGWRLPDTLAVLYSPGVPLGGSLSSQWILPDSLKFINLDRCSLSGPLPEGWPLSANLTGVVLSRNNLTGTIPSSFTTLPNLQVMDLSSNQLTGPIPADMRFGSLYEVTGLNVANNNLSGRVPEWPDYPRAQLSIQPGNADLCGTVPSAPLYVAFSGDNQQVTQVTSLPPCPGDDTSSSSNTGAIVGGVVGGVAAVALMLVGAAWYVRRRRRGIAQRQGSTGLEAGLQEIKFGLAGQSGTGSSTHSSVQPPFNPFAAGPKLKQRQSSAFASPSSSSRTLPISAAASLLAADAGSSGSDGTPEDRDSLTVKLEALQRQPPAWLIDPGRIIMEQSVGGKLVLLGRGSYGRVYRGWLNTSSSGGLSSAPLAQEPTNGMTASSSGNAGVECSDAAVNVPGTRVALKVMDAGDVNAFLKEASMMQRLADCPQVVALHGACVVGQQLVVAMELLEGGDLRAALSGEHADALSWRRQGRQVALDIAAGLAHLHAHNVMHRDLKSKNVLLTRGWRAKLGDVGTAALHSATFLSAGSSMFGGTLAWAAPELLLGAPCTNKIDVYSLGVVLWELATGEVPRRGFVQPPPPSDDCPQGLCDLIGDCLQQDPAARPTAQQALERLQAL